MTFVVGNWKHINATYSRPRPNQALDLQTTSAESPLLPLGLFTIVRVRACVGVSVRPYVRLVRQKAKKSSNQKTLLLATSYSHSYVRAFLREWNKILSKMMSFFMNWTVESRAWRKRRGWWASERGPRQKMTFLKNISSYLPFLFMLQTT